MAKAYWIATYFSISNPDALAEYAKLAGPAITAGGGRFLARTTAARCGMRQMERELEDRRLFDWHVSRPGTF